MARSSETQRGLKYAGLALAAVFGAAGALAFVFNLPYPIGIALAAGCLACFIATAVLWWQTRRRLAPHQCRECGYDIKGVKSGICPECGLVFALPAAVWYWKTRDLSGTDFCPACGLKLDEPANGTCPGCRRPLPPLVLPPPAPGPVSRRSRRYARVR